MMNVEQINHDLKKELEIFFSIWNKKMIDRIVTFGPENFDLENLSPLAPRMFKLLLLIFLNDKERLLKCELEEIELIIKQAAKKLEQKNENKSESVEK